MKRFLLALTLIGGAVPAFAADVGVSISVGEPGFYGRIDIGDAPSPRLIYRDPKVVGRLVSPEPLYLRVPPEHARNWRKHCHEYNACGRRVFFVENRWYRDVYVPHYRRRHPEHERRERQDERRHDNGRDHRDERGR
jgi:hypothetical protein